MLKRVFDILCSSAGLVLLFPLLVLIGLLVKVDSRGPVLFRQERVGRGGKSFRIYKFRTMHSGSSGRGSQLTVGDDPRITRVGRTLRHYKLDELPQLLNVLVGDMSLVGPRPEVPRYVQLWDDDTKSIVLSVRPGLTDLASIEFRNEGVLLAASDNPEERYIREVAPAKNKLAMRYVEKQNLWLDITIICKTLAAILR
jgi:lipopolysaccharide/colanic/teichoic acid biosynthesis glycosyltransferase